MKNILLINGHPDTQSFNYALHKAYMQAAQTKGLQVEEICVTELRFNPVLTHGYRVRSEMEADLLKAIEKLKAADHIVWLYPMWWGTMPALLKGFIDRSFLPGIAFKYRENSSRQEKLWQGKTSELIITLDYPRWYYKYVLHEPGTRNMKKLVLDFCGIKTTRVTYLGPVRGSSDIQLTKLIEKVQRLL